MSYLKDDAEFDLKLLKAQIRTFEVCADRFREDTQVDIAQDEKHETGRR